MLRSKKKIINYNPALFKNPLLLLIQFPERKGALRDFMRKVSGVANVCYFNYTYTGERVGRALVGMEFESAEDRETVRKRMAGFSRNIIRAIREISPEAFHRIMGSR